MSHHRKLGPGLPKHIVIMGTVVVLVAGALGDFVMVSNSRNVQVTPRIRTVVQVCSERVAQDQVIACAGRAMAMRDDPSTHPFEKPLKAWR